MRAVLKRQVFYIQIKLKSPLNVASGEDEWTDADVLRDFDGNPFVPGTSLAGAMRAYIGEKENEWDLFGYSADDIQGKMSPLFISDLIFDGKAVLGIRDGVGLNEKKVARDGCKYDMEIVETGLEGHFYLELVVREGDDEAAMKQSLSNIFCGIQQGEIRLGRKKTRGFGAFEIVKLASKSYDRENYLDYANAYERSFWESAADESNKWMAAKTDCNRMVHIRVPLVMKGGISIRQYAARKGEPDFVHLTSSGKPVIPGSSFAGAIRHRVEQILGDLVNEGVELPESVEKISKRMFGYVSENDGCASNVIISESVIQEAKALTMVRTGISRFESAVKDGALYKERTYVDGKLDLKIAVRKGKTPEESNWMIGILLLAVKDLQNGYLAVGGQTAVGRGTFAPDVSQYPEGVIFIDGKPGLEKQFIAKALKDLCTDKR